MRRPKDDANRAAQDAPAQAAQAAHAEPKRVRAPLLAAGAAVVVAVAHLGALEGAFVFDDVARIVRSEDRIAGLWPPGEWVFGTQRPLVELSLAVNHALGGLAPRGYHAFNLAVHALAVATLVLVVLDGCAALRRRGALRMPARLDPTIALSAGLLWGLHPVTTSASAYVIQRAESMAALGTVLAVLALLRASRPGGRRRLWSVAAVASVAAALCSKPTALSAPFILLAVDAGVASGSLRAVLARRWALHAACGAVLLLLLVFGVVEGALRQDGGVTGYGLGVAGATPLGYAALSIRALGLYAALCVWPPLLAIDRGPEALGSAWMPLVGAAVLASMLALVAAGIRRARWWWTLPACALLALLPTTSIVPLADASADHRLYLPLMALAIGVTALGAQLACAPGRPRAAAMMACSLLAVTLLAETAATVRRVAAYRDPVVLWTDAIERSPSHARAYINRGAHLLEAGRDDEAAADLAAAERLMPGNPALQTNLAILDIRRGDARAAMARLEVVSARSRNDAAVLGARGDALRMLGELGEAARNYALAGERAPSVALYPLLEGNVRAELGDEPAAIAAYERAIERASVDASLRASAQFNLGNLHLAAGRREAAAACYRRALEADQTHEGAARCLREAEGSREE